MSKTFEHDGCVGCKYEKESETSDYCKGCKQNAVDKYVRITNFDRIKNMGVEEMAEFISAIDIDECSGVTRIEDSEDLEGIENIKEWLEREVEE